MPNLLRLAVLLPALLLAGCFSSDEPFWKSGPNSPAGYDSLFGYDKGSTPLADGDYTTPNDEIIRLKKTHGFYYVTQSTRATYASSAKSRNFYASLIPLPGHKDSFIAQITGPGVPTLYGIVRVLPDGDWEALPPDCRDPGFSGRASRDLEGRERNVQVASDKCTFGDKASLVAALTQIVKDGPAAAWVRARRDRY